MNGRSNIKISKRKLFCFARTSFCSLMYCMALVYLLSSSVLVDWERFGISYAPDGMKYIPLFFIIIPLWASVLPERVGRPSDLFLYTTYFFICIPTLVAAFFSTIEGREHALLLLFLTIGFFIACVIVNVTKFSSHEGRSLMRKWGGVGLVFLWGCLLLLLLKEFSPVMSIVGLSEIYNQRAAGRASNLLYGYAQTYFGHVLSLVILALGFFKNKYVFIVIGYAGAFVLYAITAEKSAIAYPLIVTVLFFVLRGKLAGLSSAWFVATILAFLIFLSAYFYHDSNVASFFSTYIGARSILTPGFLTVHYLNYFSEYGFTYFSHIRGVGASINAPPILSDDSRWPLIGYMVGENYFEVPTLNANANFLAWDGVASMGSAGVLIMFIFFSLFLIALDFATKGIDGRFSIPVMAPGALILINGSLFSFMLSFGGFFLLMFFFCAFKRPR